MIDAPPTTETDDSGDANDDSGDAADSTASEGNGEDGDTTDQAPPPAADAPLTPSNAADDIDALLAEAAKLVPYMEEAKAMANHVLERIQTIRTHTSHIQDGDEVELLKIVREYVMLLREFANQPIGAYRLVHHPTIAAQIKAIHHDLDSLSRGANIAVADWETPWSHCRAVQFKAFAAMSRDRPTLFGNQILSADEKSTILLFVSHETRRAEAVHSPEWREVLERAQKNIVKLTNGPSPVVETWFLPKYDLVVGDMFGRGGFAEVHHATYLGTHVVAKFLTPRNGVAVDTVAFVKEANTWFRANKVPNVIRFFGAYHLGSKPFFVSEYAEHGTLTNYLLEHKSRTWALLLQAAHGLYGLHQLDIFHNDLKCSNILVTLDGVAKLTDFGLCSSMAEDKAACRWKAPEVFAGKREGTRASDIYSFGMCIVEAVSQAFPWGRSEDVFVRRQVKQGKLPERPSGFTPEQWALVKAMCAFEPEKRLRMDDVLARLQKFADDEFNMQLQPETKPCAPAAGISRAPSRRASVTTVQCCETAPPADPEPENEPTPSSEHDGACDTTAPAIAHHDGSTATTRQDAAMRPSVSEVSQPTATPALCAPADAVVAASVDDYRFATIGRREVVEYKVTLQLESRRTAVVWKRYSKFRHVHQHLKRDARGSSSQQELVQRLCPFPHRTPFWATYSQATIDRRRCALSAYLTSVVTTSGLLLGVRLSDTEVVYKRGEKPKYEL